MEWHETFDQWLQKRFHDGLVRSKSSKKEVWAQREYDRLESEGILEKLELSEALSMKRKSRSSVNAQLQTT
jgi:hypothetical protein